MPDPRYTHDELAALWIAAGGPQASADTAAAIALAESNGCRYAKAGPNDDRPVKTCTYRHTTSENSYGLWQINRRAHPQFSGATLYTPSGNAAAAVAVSLGGATFQPWTTYVNGAYRTHLTGSTLLAGGAAASPSERPADSPSGWHELTKALATDLPSALNHSRILTRAATRNLARVRRR